MAENLWYLREQRKISVAGLANRAGLPIGLIMEYEAGQRGIDPRHLNRLARALYVEDSEIRLLSEPRAGAPPLEKQNHREPGPEEPSPQARPDAPPRQRDRGTRGRGEHRLPPPPRPSQLAHLEVVLAKLGRSEADVEKAIGKPVSSLDRSALSELLKTLQEEARQVTVERRRGYLPESVDQYEARFLTAAVDSGDRFHFTLFDGRTLDGRVLGFGPYTITISAPDGAEHTLNKLALVSYTRALPEESGP